MRDVWAGADLGSTNIKVLLTDGAGTVLARASRPTPRIGVHSDPDALVDALEELLLTAAHDLGPVRLRAVCVAGVGEDGVLHASGRPLGPALPWFAPQRQAALDALRSLRGEDDRRRYGVELDAARTVAAWALLPATDVCAATGWVSCTDYPALRWTGRAVMSASLAPRTGAWLLDEERWDADRVEPFLPVELLPEVVPAGTVLGPLRAPRLVAAGVLAHDAVVVAGGHDHPVGGAVVHRQDPGAPLDSMGTAEVLVRTIPGDRPAPTGVDLSPAVIDDGWTALTVIELDRNVSWLRRHGLGPAVDAVVAGKVTPADAGLFLPGDEGGGEPRWAPAAHGLSDAERAFAAIHRLALVGAEALGRLAPEAEAVYAAGGWTRAPGWMRLKASATGMPYWVLAEPELTALGAAQLCLGDAAEPVPVRAIEP
ncbi:FGGY family carbohydrate kinase [Micromonospora sp. CPCC 206060]|uniref:FGGY-family carbohydrate kinase n=1 Tax=Micromonospora sp. CPCC 206060 TaxID=3122406 RepID=UPI002FF03285